jgi:hypothetical protein
LFGIIVGEDKLATYIDPGPDFDSLEKVASSADTFGSSLKYMRESLSEKQDVPVHLAMTNNMKPLQLAKASPTSALSMMSSDRVRSNPASLVSTFKAEAPHELTKAEKVVSSRPVLTFPFSPHLSSPLSPHLSLLTCPSHPPSPPKHHIFTPPHRSLPIIP